MHGDLFQLQSKLLVAACAPLLAGAYMMPAAVPRTAAAARAGATFMDETIIEKALSGELEEEGAGTLASDRVILLGAPHDRPCLDRHCLST